MAEHGRFDPEFYDPAKAVTGRSQDRRTIIPGSGDRYNGMVIPGTGWPDSAKGRFPEASDPQSDYLFRGVQQAAIPTSSTNDFQPRLGIAYQITPKTVIRAGGGRFFTRLGVSDSIFLGGNPPFQPTANVSFGNVDNPGGTSDQPASADRHHAEQGLQESRSLELELHGGAASCRATS